MYLSDATTSYDNIYMIKNEEHCSVEIEEDYYSNVYIIKNEKDLKAMYANRYLSFPENDEGYNHFVANTSILIYFFIQIPKGFSGYKRNNTQAYINGREGLTMITDNFYYYSSRNNMLYCVVDLEKSESKENSVFSFFFEVPYVYRDLLVIQNFNIVLSDNAK